MRALITGSAGFVGRHMAAALESAGYEVLRSDPRHPSARSSSDCRAWFDARPPVEVDLCVHCAALVDGRETIDHKSALLAAYNLQLDGAMFEWALRTRPQRVVYFSSSAAYPTRLQDHGSNVELHESDIALGSPSLGVPDATYGWVKLTGEIVAGELRKAGVPVTVVRPFSGYGEDQDDCYPFPAMIARGRRHDDPFVVWGDGEQVRDFIHIDDVVCAVLALVEGEIDGPVNLGTGRGTSMNELARLVMATAGYEAPIQHLIDKPKGVDVRVASVELLHQFYRPRITIEEGVRRALKLHELVAT